MKKLLFGMAAALLSLSVFATTFTPLSLLSPTGSTSGQAIVSTGPTSAPAWSNVSAAALTGITPVVNGGTGASTASAALTSLGAAATAGSTFTGRVGISYANAVVSVNDSGGSNEAQLALQNSGVTAWELANLSFSSNQFSIARYVSGTFVDIPFAINNSTGASAFTVRPTFAGNTPWDSGNLVFATPPAIGTTTPAAGKFTTLQATAAITPVSTSGIVGTLTNDNASAGSIGEYPTPTNLTNVTLVSGSPANVSSVPLTAGDWNVQCEIDYGPSATTTATQFASGPSATSATFGGAGTYANQVASMAANTGIPSIVSPVGRILLSATTTVYCVAQSTFAVSTMNASGHMTVRRAR